MVFSAAPRISFYRTAKYRQVPGKQQTHFKAENTFLDKQRIKLMQTLEPDY